MFDKLVVSSSTRKDRRLSKFFLGSVVLYLTAVAGALILTIALANPQLVSATGGANVPLLSAPPMQQIEVAPSSPHPSRPAPSVDFRDIATIDHVNDPHTPVASAFSPPHPPQFEPVDGNLQSNGGGCCGPGYGRGDGPGSGLVARTSTSPPPRPKPEPTPVKQGPIKVSPGVLQGKAISKPIPPYPELARLTHRFGKVDVEIVVSPEGKVESARAISGDPVFRSAAVQAALNWRFEPTRLGETPVRVTGVITFVFTLGE